MVINSTRCRSSFYSVLTMSSTMRSWSTPESPWSYQTINKIIINHCLSFSDFFDLSIMNMLFWIHSQSTPVRATERKCIIFYWNFYWNYIFGFQLLLLLFNENAFPLPFLSLSKKNMKQWRRSGLGRKRVKKKERTQQSSCWDQKRKTSHGHVTFKLFFAWVTLILGCPSCTGRVTV